MSDPAKLTEIDGIGPATAKRLAKAGIATVAHLAAAKPDTLRAIKGMPNGSDFDAWVAAARKLQPADAPKQHEPSAASASVIEEAGEQGKAAAKDAAVLQPASGDRTPREEEDAYDGPVLLVSGPKRGFWRSGLRFDAGPRALTPADLGEGIAGMRKFVAILKEPRLVHTLRAPDGAEIRFDTNAVRQLEAALADVEKDGGDEADLAEAFARLMNAG